MKTVILFPFIVMVTAWFYFQQVSPSIYLKVNEKLYSDLTIECHQTQLLMNYTKNKNGQLGKSHYRRLIQTAQVGSEYCRRQEQLQAKLLGSNIKMADLREIELEALGTEYLPFRRFIESLGEDGE